MQWIGIELEAKLNWRRCAERGLEKSFHHDLTDDQFDMNEGVTLEFPENVNTNCECIVAKASVRLVGRQAVVINCVKEEQRVASILISDRVKNDRFMDLLTSVC